MRLVLELADGREVRFRDIRKFGKIGLYGRDPVTGELVPRSAERRSSPGSDPSRSTTRSPCASSDAACDGGRDGSSRCCSTSRSWPGSATSTPTRRCGRRDSIRCGPPGRSIRPTSGTSMTRFGTILAEAIERRGSSIDDYTAPDGDGSMQEHLQVYQRTGEPCPRCGRPIKRIVIGARSTHFCSWCQRLGGGRPEGGGRDPARHDRWAAAGRRRWTRAGRGGDARADPRRGRGRGDPGTDRTNEAGRGDTAGGRAGIGGRAQLGCRARPTARPPSPDPSDEHPSAVGGDAARSARSSSSMPSTHPSRSATGSGWSGRTGPARRRSSGWPPDGTSPTAARSTESVA